MFGCLVGGTRTRNQHRTYGERKNKSDQLSHSENYSLHQRPSNQDAKHSRRAEARAEGDGGNRLIV